MKTRSEMQEPIPGELRNIPLLEAAIAILSALEHTGILI